MSATKKQNKTEQTVSKRKVPLIFLFELISYCLHFKQMNVRMCFGRKF